VPQDLYAATRDLDLGENVQKIEALVSEKHIFAVEHIRRMRGGTQSQMMRCSDGYYYVVKFQNNPQGKRFLTNDLLGSLLAKALWLPVAEPVVVEVSREIIANTEAMVVQLSCWHKPLQEGLCFGSRHPLGKSRLSSSITHRVVHDFLPSEQMQSIRNIMDVAGMLVFDKWTCNTDNRQTIFVKLRKIYRVMMIDQGFCFNGGEWNFPDSPYRCLNLYQSVYERMPSFGTFEFWLDRLERDIDRDLLETVAHEIPPEWYDDDSDPLNRLLDWLDRRRGGIADLVWGVWKMTRKSFPNRFSVCNRNTTGFSKMSDPNASINPDNWRAKAAGLK
jgi:hypothetical protein